MAEAMQVVEILLGYLCTIRTQGSSAVTDGPEDDGQYAVEDVVTAPRGPA